MFKTWLPILILFFLLGTVGCKKNDSAPKPDAAGVQAKKARVPAEKPVEAAPDCPTMCAHVVDIVRQGMDEAGREQLDKLKPTVTGMCVRNCHETLDDEGRRCVAETTTEDGIKQCKIEAEGRIPQGKPLKPKSE